MLVLGLVLDHHCFHIIWTVTVADMEDSRRLEKILAPYIDIINSVSFDSDTKFACRHLYGYCLTLFIHKTICCLRRNWSFLCSVISQVKVVALDR